MFKTVMVPVDLAHLPRIERALQVAADLAKHYGAGVSYVSVTAATPGPLAHNPKEYGEKLAAFAAEDGARRGVSPTTHVMVAHDPTADVDDALLKAVDETLAELEGGKPTNEEEMFVAFDHTQYEEEVKERWGDTDAYKQSRERLKGMTKADYDRLAAENEAFVAKLAATFTSGVAADSEQAMDLAEEARLAIDRQFYECSKAMHVNLGEMYVADPRFTATYDTHAEGLAVWFRDAIVANAAR